MRVNLTAHFAGTLPSAIGTIPLSLNIRPACGLPGEFSYPTDSDTLLTEIGYFID